jgi:hypothetical protein
MNDIFVRLIPKTDTGRLIVNEEGDHFTIKALNRYVTFSEKKDWFVLQSQVTKTILHVHSSEDEHFTISKPL